MGVRDARVLDGSKVDLDFTGAVIEEARHPGAVISRVMHPPGQTIETHAHDWPMLALYRIGSYREFGDDGVIAFDGPSVVFQPAGVAHADEIGARGLETVSMTFDPAWLDRDVRAALPKHTLWRSGGAAGAAAGRLIRVWLSGDDAKLRVETSRFVAAVIASPAQTTRPSWGEHAEAAIDEEAPTEHLARTLDLHPAWLARAYRSWRGEGIGETARRRRVERAVLRLRGSAAALAEIAAECGFCDQSHMNRAFRAVLGRTPLEVRREAALLAPLSA